MKNILLIFTVIISFSAHSAEKTILDCPLKDSYFTIVKTERMYEIRRSVLNNKVSPNDFFRGGVATESYGVLKAKTVKFENNILDFTLDTDKYLRFFFNKKENSLIDIHIESNVKYIADDLREILRTEISPLTFAENICTVTL